MSYCRWSEGDLYAYRASTGYVVHVAAHATGGQVRDRYEEPNARTLLARLLWLGSKGCDYPWDALRRLRDDVIAEVDGAEDYQRLANPS